MIICGDNPCAFFYFPDSARLAIGYSYWHVSFSTFGSGNILFSIEKSGNEVSLDCYYDNRLLAEELHHNINRHFEIFKDFQDSPVNYAQGHVKNMSNRSNYKILLYNNHNEVSLHFKDLRQPVQTSVILDNFGADNITKYQVYATIIESGSTSLARNGKKENFTTINRYANFNSSAFLSLGESWKAL